MIIFNGDCPFIHFVVSDLLMKPKFTMM